MIFPLLRSKYLVASVWQSFYPASYSYCLLLFNKVRTKEVTAFRDRLRRPQFQF
jgi:hypothetical protein